ncbi:hypothetical protein [Reyranella sp.]|uniref:hypothetical protein n=1 Tax=Reyranella sp. TaxID=1929291 RepID=UPI003D0DFCDE
MKLPVALDREAGIELHEHLARLAELNPAAARALSARVSATLDLISDFLSSTRYMKETCGVRFYAVGPWGSSTSAWTA